MPAGAGPEQGGARGQPAKPRRVRAGLKLQAADETFEQFWAAKKWLSLVERAVDAEKLATGLEYARLGQTRRMMVEPGMVSGLVQGRAERSYSSGIALQPFSTEQWDRVIAAMSEQTRYAAKIVAGELSEDALELFDQLGLTLFPSASSDLRPSCTCSSQQPMPAPMSMRPMRVSPRPSTFIPPPTGRPLRPGFGVAGSAAAPPAAADTKATTPSAVQQGSSPAGSGVSSALAADGANRSTAVGGASAGGPSDAGSGTSQAGQPSTRSDWCRHSVCLAYIVAERLMQEPLLIFTLRGMPAGDVLERIREHRAMAGSSGTTPVYQHGVPGVSELNEAPLPADDRQFWDEDADLALLDFPLDRPDPTHPLLRRLGPSPFEEGRFPLVGLLATCYDLATEHTLRSRSVHPDRPAASGADDGNGKRDAPR